MKEEVEAALARIRPAILADGGDIELVEVNEETGSVSIRLTGACSGCPMSAITLKEGVERVVKRLVPEVSEVNAVM